MTVTLSPEKQAALLVAYHKQKADREATDKAIAEQQQKTKLENEAYWQNKQIKPHKSQTPQTCERCGKLMPTGTMIIKYVVAAGSGWNSFCWITKHRHAEPEMCQKEKQP